MTAKHIQLGMHGEDIAAQHLEQAGYTIIARRFSIDGIETDIVARRGEMLHFVEVKSRTATPNGALNRDTAPESAVGSAKIARLERAAESYMMEHRLECELSIDLIAIALNPQGHLISLHHYMQIGR